MYIKNIKNITKISKMSDIFDIFENIAIFSYPWPDNVFHLPTLWQRGRDSWTFTSVVAKMGSRTSVSFRCRGSIDVYGVFQDYSNLLEFLYFGASAASPVGIAWRHVATTTTTTSTTSSTSSENVLMYRTPYSHKYLFLFLLVKKD